MKIFLFLLAIIGGCIALISSAEAKMIIPDSPLYRYEELDSSRFQFTRSKQTWYYVVRPDNSFYQSFNFPKPKTRPRTSYGY